MSSSSIHSSKRTQFLNLKRKSQDNNALRERKGALDKTVMSHVNMYRRQIFENINSNEMLHQREVNKTNLTGTDDKKPTQKQFKGKVVLS